MAMTPEQKAAAFGDQRDWQEREMEKFEGRKAELIRRLQNGEYLTRADAKDARRYLKSTPSQA